MQPALAEVVQYPTFPLSTATTGARLSPSRSLPWCARAARFAEVVAEVDRADDGEETGRLSGGTAATRLRARWSDECRIHAR